MTKDEKMHQLVVRMEDWATQQKSLAEYNEKQGRADVRVALLGSALTVEGWAKELQKLVR